MAEVKFETVHFNDSERKFAESISALINKSVFHDCRNAAPIIKILSKNFKLDMVVGCGGSHIYIHRTNEFIDGDHTNLKNIRWAIITD